MRGDTDVRQSLIRLAAPGKTARHSHSHLRAQRPKQLQEPAVSPSAAPLLPPPGKPALAPRPLLPTLAAAGEACGQFRGAYSPSACRVPERSAPAPPEPAS